MAQLINFGGDVIRINSLKNIIEYSTNGGCTWTTRCSDASVGTFINLSVFGGELLACTSKGVYSSQNSGKTWSARCILTSYGSFFDIFADGSNLWATTSRGLYYSVNSGRSWCPR
ncbi:hypothetical protein [Hoylesella shahii]|uniref:WD40/YVTN/BNR-like repeat-containing protein n=1 Tax=Hoylesella shahii TaxID=228603 RepID=UPI0028D8BC7C|nr:hypothetical protein [Hoylesella shahii]